MKKACQISAQALVVAGENIRAGMTTLELDRILHHFIVSQGAKPSFLGYGGFPGTACISVNDEVIHGIPSSERVLREGDIVSVDVGACIGGFHGDNAFTFPVGQIGEEAKKLLDVTQKSLYLAIGSAISAQRFRHWWSKTVLPLSANMWDMAWAITCMKIRRSPILAGPDMASGWFPA